MAATMSASGYARPAFVGFDSVRSRILAPLSRFSRRSSERRFLGVSHSRREEKRGSRIATSTPAKRHHGRHARAVLLELAPEHAAQEALLGADAKPRPEREDREPGDDAPRAGRGEPAPEEHPE